MISMVVMLSLARCAPAGCGCPGEWAVLGTVSSGPDGGAVVSGGTAFGPAPAEVDASDARVGDRVLISSRNPYPMVVSSSGEISCGNVRLDASSYGASIADGTCGAALDAAGYRPPPCRDTHPFCGCSLSVTEMSLAALIIIAIRSMKRRRD